MPTSRQLGSGLKSVEGQVLHLKVTPIATSNGEGLIGVKPADYSMRPVTVREATKYALKQPVNVVVGTMVNLGMMLTGRMKPDLAGPIGIVRETARAASEGSAQFFFILGLISAYLGAFNLLPIPALDGGRLMFLAYEATTRRRPDPKVEAHVHAVGLVMMLALVLVVTIVVDIPGRGH